MASTNTTSVSRTCGPRTPRALADIGISRLPKAAWLSPNSPEDWLTHGDTACTEPRLWLLLHLGIPLAADPAWPLPRRLQLAFSHAIVSASPQWGQASRSTANARCM